jgi:hypothetical protein
MYFLRGGGISPSLSSWKPLGDLGRRRWDISTRVGLSSSVHRSRKVRYSVGPRQDEKTAAVLTISPNLVYSGLPVRRTHLSSYSHRPNHSWLGHKANAPLPVVDRRLPRLKDFNTNRHIGLNLMGSCRTLVVTYGGANGEPSTTQCRGIACDKG